jgi:hypothetical protein
MGAVLALLLMLYIYLFLRKSSRGHRIILESALFLLLLFPTAGFQLASDYNIHFDHHKPYFIKAKVVNHYEVEKRRRRGIYSRRRGRPSYYIELAFISRLPNIELPKKIKVRKSFYDRTQIDSTIGIFVGPGRLGHPWIKSIDIID